MRHVIITGATGMIGLALIDELVKRGVQVSAIYRKDSPRTQAILQHSLVEKIECDLSELYLLPQKINAKCDAFFHMGWVGTTGAARNDTMMQTRNIKYALDAVRAAATLGCRVFIGAGSQAEYGGTKDIFRTNTFCEPETAYGVAKLCAGEMTRLECEAHGVKQIWARILSVYGLGDAEGTLINHLISSFLMKEVPACTKGEQTWDFLYSADAARALIALSFDGHHGVKYPLGSGRSQPLKNYICAVRDAIDPDLQIGFGEIPYSDTQVMRLIADISELTKDTGFSPEVSFEEGIRKTIEYYKTGRRVQ